MIRMNIVFRDLTHFVLGWNLNVPPPDREVASPSWRHALQVIMLDGHHCLRWTSNIYSLLIVALAFARSGIRPRRSRIGKHEWLTLRSRCRTKCGRIQGDTVLSTRGVVHAGSSKDKRINDDGKKHRMAPYSYSNMLDLRR